MEKLFDELFDVSKELKRIQRTLRKDEFSHLDINLRYSQPHTNFNTAQAGFIIFLYSISCCIVIFDNFIICVLVDDLTQILVAPHLSPQIHYCKFPEKLSKYFYRIQCPACLTSQGDPG